MERPRPGTFPLDSGETPPSDTTALRVLQPDLGEQHVDPGCAADGDVPVVGQHGDALEEFLQQHSTLLVGASLPGPVVVEVGQGSGHVVEPPGHVVGLLGLGLVGVRLGRGRHDKSHVPLGWVCTATIFSVSSAS